MRFLAQLAVAIAAALAATFAILEYEVAGHPMLLAALLLSACCLGPLAGLLPTRGPSVTSGTDTPGREQGEVKWFNVSKGFGFIRRENGEEIFVHFRSVQSSNRSRRLLSDGQRVAFRVAHSDKGPQAEDVEILE
jgi:CspA family cold shock protein